jgi:hypothetical protein
MNPSLSTYKNPEVTRKAPTMRAQNQNAASSCVVCEHVITNPICPDCLSTRMRSWLAEVNPEIASDVDGFSIPGETHCLFCNQEMGICAHCYSKDVYEQILLKDVLLAREFVARFDFDLRRDLVA